MGRVGEWVSGRALIVNADDFGISEGVNRGVAEACERGILTSATLMVNMPAFEDALRVARGLPNLGLGVHLNLTSGVPVLPPQRVHGLVGPKGRFLPMGTLLRGLTLGRVPLTQAEAELSAQIEKALEAGVAVTHLDSHHHVHVHPALHGLVVRLARRYGIKAVRSTVELRAGGLSSHIAASRLEGRESTPEFPAGALHQGRDPQRLRPPSRPSGASRGYRRAGPLPRPHPRHGLHRRTAPARPGATPDRRHRAYVPPRPPGRGSPPTNFLRRRARVRAGRPPGPPRSSRPGEARDRSVRLWSSIESAQAAVSS